MSGINRRNFLKGVAITAGAAAIQGAPAFLRYGRGEVPIKWGSIHPMTGPYATEASTRRSARKLQSPTSTPGAV